MDYTFENVIAANELADELSLEILGDKNQILQKISNINCNESNAIKFSKGHLNKYLRGIIIGPSGLNAETLLVSINPRLDFCRALNFLIDNRRIAVSPRSSVVHSSARIAETAILEEGVSIGQNTIIEHNVVIHKNTSIGQNCIIRSNTVIGAGVKTDNLVHIAHNCNIGKNCILTACTELSGGVFLGENVWVGPNSSIKEKVLIGMNSLIGIGSVVRKNVDENSVVSGSPARFIKKR
jgi:UDP-3-O-[3-hydroxymyristoyl] glucosamine N-acyltransferase